MKRNSVGRLELLAWINETLHLNLSKVEQTSNGAFACQLLDRLFPGSVNLAKVDFNARDDYTSLSNYKLLQAGFNKLGIAKPINVEGLMRSRPLDNMHFMQWFKEYYEKHAQKSAQYDFVAKRQASKTGDVQGGMAKAPRKPVPKIPLTSLSITSIGSNLPVSHGSPQPHAARHDLLPSTLDLAANAQPLLGPEGATAAGSTLHAQERPEGDTGSFWGEACEIIRSHRLERDLVDIQEQQGIDIETVKQEVVDIRNSIDVLERERDFYFDKLREVEVLCQDEALSQTSIIQFIRRILYATDEQEAKNAMLEAFKLYSTEPLHVS